MRSNFSSPGGQFAAACRHRVLAEARRVLAAGGRLLAMAVCRFASLLDGAV